MSGVIPLLSSPPIRLHDVHMDTSTCMRGSTIVLSVTLRGTIKTVDIDLYRFVTVENRDIAKYPGTVPLCSASRKLIIY
jgi:hypothetical protein